MENKFYYDDTYKKNAKIFGKKIDMYTTVGSYQKTMLKIVPKSFSWQPFHRIYSYKQNIKEC